jgi:AraC-like DNA-binding protein
MPQAQDPIAFQADFFHRNPNAFSVTKLFEHTPSVYFYAKDAQSRYIKVNRETLTIFNLDNEVDLLGRTDREFQPPALAEAYLAEDRRVMAGRQTIANQVWLVPHVKGAPKWHVSTKTPLFDPKEKVIGIAGAMFPITTPADQQMHFRELLPALNHIDEHYQEHIAIETLAELTRYSITHFNRRFRELLRVSPTEHILSLRIQEAQRLLTTTSLPMSQVAAQIGFCDQSHFTKRFKKATGMRPLEYQKRFR